MKLVIPIGIGESGKFTLYNKIFKDKGLVYVYPHNICKSLTSGVSDQSKNKVVFEKAHK